MRSFPAKKPTGRPRIYSLAQRLRGKALFLEGKTWREIGNQTGMSPEALRHEARREKWSLLRQTPEARAQAIAHITASLAEFNASVTTETQSLSLEAMPLVRASIGKGSARDLKDSAMGLKTLVELARLTAGIDEKDTTKSAPSIGLFFFNEPVQRARPELDVTPSVTIEKAALAEVEFE